jgi:dihydrofolate synthase/folylpolyglutamate synthase
VAEEYNGDFEFGGIYQRKNIGTFLKCVELIGTEGGKRKAESGRLKAEKSYGLTLLQSYGILNSAIRHLHQNTGFMGRWQIISEKPLTICDVAHNTAGIELVMKQLQQLPHNRLHIILGFANDKNIDEIIPLLPKNATYYTCQANVERAMPAQELFEKLSPAILRVVCIPEIVNAYKHAVSIVEDNDIIFIGGSFFVVGEFLNAF